MSIQQTIATLTQQVAELTRERDNWMDCARQQCENGLFYHNLLTQIGEKFGVAAKTSDDGSVQQDVLALRVPELVDKALANLAAMTQNRDYHENNTAEIGADYSRAMGKLAKAEADLAAERAAHDATKDWGHAEEGKAEKLTADLAAERERRLVLMRRVGERYECLRKELIAACAESAQWKDQAEKAEEGLADYIADRIKYGNEFERQRDELAALLREIRDSHHDNTAGGCPGAGDRFADAINRIDAALAKVGKENQK